jgi:ribosomal protein L37AE/L43A
MTHREVERTVERSGLYVAATGQAVRCQNPHRDCSGRAVTRDPKSGLWVCQHCADILADVHWGLGHE